jgi:molecular chaperone DnaK (HSP70)
VRLGIDFGTTRTVVAFCDRGNYPVASFTDGAGDAVECFPSVVAERAGELRFGFEAERVASSPEWTVLRSFKRLLNDPSPEATVVVGSTTLRMVDLLAQFFAALRRALEQSNLAERLAPGEAMQAFVAAPAHAHSTQRFICLDAFRRGGFDVLGLLNEPSAAGFEYTHRYRNTLTSKKDHVLVYDIGGGTFDVSLLRMSGPLHEVVRTAGINRLGGDDFDAIMADLALAKARIKPKAVTPRMRALLIEQCRSAKEQLHPTSRRISLDLASSLGKLAREPELSLDVAAYYEACAPLIERTIAAMLAVVQPEGETETTSALPADIAGIYVVGGASALPCVARALRDQFGKRVHRSPYPSAAAAIGLAIAADDGAGLQLIDRFSRVFGVFREGDSGSNVTFDPIFDHDLLLPKEANAPAVVERTYRAAHNIGHFRYVECSEVDPAGHPRGDMASFSDIYFPFDVGLRHPGSSLDSVHVKRVLENGPRIRERYAVSPHGIVEVRITDLDDHYEMAYRLAPNASA